MAERRISMEQKTDLHTNPRENKLKAVAGLIKGLSYSDMLKFVNLIHKEMQMDPGKPATNIAGALLEVSEQILREKEIG